MSISDALAYARRRDHEHRPGKVYEVPDGLVVDERHEVRHLITNCRQCGQTTHAQALYVNGQQVKATAWVSNGEAASAAWAARGR